MADKKITLNREKAEIIMRKRLEKSLKLDEYKEITRRFKEIKKNSGDLTTEPDFQQLFCSSYVISGAGKDSDWKNDYFSVFNEFMRETDSEKITYEAVLLKLQSKEHIKDKCEASFASKMLHTLNPQKPILDNKVEKYLGLSRNVRKEEKISKAIENYKKIEKAYDDFLTTDEAKACLRYFDELFPDSTDVSAVKKIDFFLWGRN